MRLGLEKNKGAGCLICGLLTQKFTEKDGHFIYKCINCGFGYTDQLKAQKGSYHRDDTYIIEEDLFKNIFQRRVNEIYKFLKSGSVLEIGSSTGLMLSLFKEKGFEAKGVEISKKAAAMAEKRGIATIVSPFEKIKFNEKFDLVILNHTLEHLEDPVIVLEKVKKVLKPKGYVMIDLPNFESPVARILKGKWSHLLPDEHLWHFTRKSFEILFKKLDFKLVSVKRASGVWDYASPHKQVFNSLIKFKKRFIGDTLTAIPSLVMTKLNKGSDLLVIARKK